jgi:hypothetical protein
MSVTSSTAWLQRMMLKGGSKMCVGTGMSVPLVGSSFRGSPQG